MMTSGETEEGQTLLMVEVHTTGHHQHLMEMFGVASRSIQGHAELSVATSVFRPGATATPVNTAGRDMPLSIIY